MANKKKVAKAEELTNEDAVKDLEDKLAHMIEDRDSKCEAAKKQLVDMLEITADKYRTATGMAEALRVLRFTHGENGPRVLLGDVGSLATRMCNAAISMAKKAKDLEPSEMDVLCDGFYEKDLARKALDAKAGISSFEFAYEMMCIDLCRNVGGAAEDLKAFVTRANEEIEETRKSIEELKAEKDM